MQFPAKIVLPVAAVLLWAAASNVLGKPVPAQNRNRITIMGTADFGGQFELDEEGARGWSVLKTYADRVKRNRINGASRAFLFHTGDLSGLSLNPHDNPDSKHAIDVLERQGVDLLQYTGFDAVAVRKAEETDLSGAGAGTWPSLVRFRANEALMLDRPEVSRPFRIWDASGPFVWLSAVEPPSDQTELAEQITSLKSEIWKNRAAEVIVLLFAQRTRAISHDESETAPSIEFGDWLKGFREDVGNPYHPLPAESRDQFPYNKILILVAGERGFFRLSDGITVCRIPSGEICQVELDFRQNRKSITQHWISLSEDQRTYQFIPADPGLEKILH